MILSKAPEVSVPSSPRLSHEDGDSNCHAPQHCWESRELRFAGPTERGPERGKQRAKSVIGDVDVKSLGVRGCHFRSWEGWERGMKEKRDQKMKWSGS